MSVVSDASTGVRVMVRTPLRSPIAQLGVGVLRLHRAIRFAKSLCCAQDDNGKNHRLSGRLRNVKENTGKTGFSLPQSIYLCNPHPCIVNKIPCRETRHGLQSRRPETSSAFCLA